jgi:hypothetical protein
VLRRIAPDDAERPRRQHVALGAAVPVQPHALHKQQPRSVHSCSTKRKSSRCASPYHEAVGEEDGTVGEAHEQVLLGRRRGVVELPVGERREVGRQEERPDGVGVGRGAEGRRDSGRAAGVPRRGAGDRRREEVLRQARDQAVGGGLHRLLRPPFADSAAFDGFDPGVRWVVSVQTIDCTAADLEVEMEKGFGAKHWDARENDMWVLEVVGAMHDDLEGSCG